VPIDWFTVAAQALNFIILVWLMKRFLYKPILNAIDTREKRIAAELADADAKKSEARDERDEFQRKNREFDQQRATLLSQATDQANAEGERLLDSARTAADALSAKRLDGLQSEVKTLQQAIRQRTQEEVFAITRKALTDLATTSLEERIGEVFTRRLRAMDGQTKAGLTEALTATSEPAVVRSAHELPANQRTAIQAALNETFSADLQVTFETAPSLVGGIELSANGHKIAWSIAGYLDALAKDVGQMVDQHAAPRPSANSRTDPMPVVNSQ